MAKRTIDYPRLFIYSLFFFFLILKQNQTKFHRTYEWANEKPFGRFHIWQNRSLFLRLVRIRTYGPEVASWIDSFRIFNRDLFVFLSKIRTHFTQKFGHGLSEVTSTWQYSLVNMLKRESLIFRCPIFWLSLLAPILYFLPCAQEDCVTFTLSIRRQQHSSFNSQLQYCKNDEKSAPEKNNHNHGTTFWRIYIYIQIRINSANVRQQIHILYYQSYGKLRPNNTFIMKMKERTTPEIREERIYFLFNTPVICCHSPTHVWHTFSREKEVSVPCISRSRLLFACVFADDFTLTSVTIACPVSLRS